MCLCTAVCTCGPICRTKCPPGLSCQTYRYCLFPMHFLPCSFLYRFMERITEEYRARLKEIRNNELSVEKDYIKSFSSYHNFGCCATFQSFNTELFKLKAFLIYCLLLCVFCVESPWGQKTKILLGKVL